MKHKYRDGAQTSKVSADDAAAELERIRLKNKRLTASGVVAAAKPEGAVLHPLFEWDNAKCGVEYRNHQARVLIRAVHVVSESPGDKSVPVYVHIKSEDGKRPEGDYRQMTYVVQHVDQFAVALSELQRRVRSALESVDELKRAAGAVPGGDDRMLMISLAVKALETASDAVAKMH